MNSIFAMYPNILTTVLTVLLPYTLALHAPLVQDPRTDPFYHAPTNLPLYPPGIIIRSRQIAASFIGITPNPISAYQLLYRTTAINGSAIPAVTTIFKPLLPLHDRFISFQTAYDSACVTCEPSYSYQLGTPQTDVIPSLEEAFIQRHLLQGYIVSSPDHEGPEAALCGGRLAGMVVLDGMRAVLNFKDELGLVVENPLIVGSGYSGGALATAWAASLHSSYAPELRVMGWVAGGTPSNLTATLLKIDNTAYSGFIPIAIDGLCKESAYGATMWPVIDSIVTERGRAVLDYANEHCFVADMLNFVNQSIFSTDVQVLGPTILQHPVIQRILEENVLGINQAERPVVPVFVYHGGEDKVIPFDDAYLMAGRWCESGVDVTFTEYVGRGHPSTIVLAVGEVGRFIERAFAGTVEPGCWWNAEMRFPLDGVLEQQGETVLVHESL